MTTLLTVSLYPQVRAALGVLIDDTLLPDSVIAMDLYAGRAQTWLEERDSQWATRTGSARQHLVNAVVLRCAGLLATAMPAMTAEKIGDEYSYSGQAPDWQERAGALLSDAESEVQAVIATDDDEAATAYMPTFFTVARPTTSSGLVGGRGR